MDCLWSLSHIIQKEENINVIYKCNILDKLLKLAQAHKASQVVTPILKILGHIFSTDNNFVINHLIQLEVVEMYFDLLMNSDLNYTQINEILWSISNIAAGPLEHI